MKIGLLLPSSTYLPGIGRDVMNALESGLATDADDTHEVVVETTRFNASDLDVGPKAQDLLVKHQVDILVAPLNAAVVDVVGRLASASRTPLIVNTLGEDLVTAGPGVFTNSFNLWESAWLTGNRSAQAHGAAAATCVGFHDGGYAMSFAFGLGVEAAGGRVVSSSVTHVATANDDPSEELQRILAADPDFVMGFYSGDEATSFLDAWSSLGAAAVPLCWLPDLGEHRAATPARPPVGTRSIGSWSSDASEPFQARLEAEIGSPINAYTVLAYETGGLIADAVRRQTASPDTDLGDCLAEARATGPRGTVRLDSTTSTTLPDFSLYDVRPGTGGIEHHRIEAVPAPPLLAEQGALARKNMAKTGWTNPYLIA